MKQAAAVEDNKQYARSVCSRILPRAVDSARATSETSTLFLAEQLWIRLPILQTRFQDQ